MSQPTPMFFEKWAEDSARGRIVREIDPIQSEFPAHSGSGVASGFQVADFGSASILLSIPSSTWFKPRMLWLTNYGAVKDKINLLVGGSVASCSATLGQIWVEGNDTAFIAMDGVTVGLDLWASGGTVGSIGVRIAGILVQSGPEN